MRFVSHKITIVSIRKPQRRNINQELQWFGSSLGLFGPRDKDKSCFRVFIELLKSAKKGTPLNSDEIAAKLGLTRGTVLHHINRLIEAGIVIHQNNKYILRVDTLKELVAELEKDVKRTMDDLKLMGEELDKWMENY